MDEKIINMSDRDAFNKLTDAYGWKLYSHIRRNTDSREQADMVFNETFSRIYGTMKSYDSDDALEAMLMMYSDSIGQNIKAQPQTVMPPHFDNGFLENVQPEGKKDRKGRKEGKKRSGFRKLLNFIGVLILLLAIAAIVWVMVGLLMDLKVIPYFDLGYSWFNANIVDWF